MECREMKWAELNTLRDLFEDELGDVYDAEKQILTGVAENHQGCERHRTVGGADHGTSKRRGQVERLEQAFESVDLA